MIAMDHTIAGAASGEIAISFATPKEFTISGKRTEEYGYLFGMLLIGSMYLIFVILMTMRLERIQSLFLLDFICSRTIRIKGRFIVRRS